MKFIWLPVVILLSYSVGKSQPVSNDSLKAAIKAGLPPLIKYNDGETNLNGNLVYHNLDTTLDYLHLVGPAIKYFYNNLSNNGSAADPQFFDTKPYLLTDLGIHAFDYPTGKWTPEVIRYYKMNKKYSEFTYHQGAGPEQQVKVTMAQNITNNWTAGFDFKRLTSFGFLANSRTFHTNFDFYTAFTSSNNRYHLFGYTLWNSIKNKANGGVLSDSLVDASNFSNAELPGVTVNLRDASQRWRNHYFGLKHYYDFGKIAGKDSIFSPVFRIKHEVVYERGSYSYSDNSKDSSFYQNYYFDSLTVDSLHYDQLINKFLVSHFSSSGDSSSILRHINLEAGGGSQSFIYRQPLKAYVNKNGLDTTLTNYFVEAVLIAGNEEKAVVNADGKYVFSGANSGNYSFDGSILLHAGKLFVVRLGINRFEQSPSLVQNIYRSNHYIWENDFANTAWMREYGSINLERYKLAAGMERSSIDNYIYFNDAAYPDQYNGRLKIDKAFVQKNFLFGKFKFNNELWWQYLEGQGPQSVIHLPKYLLHHTFIYESWFFKKKLLAQAGIDVHYTSKYFSNSFSPATAQYFLQNEVETNDYSLIDVFVNFKVKTARVFLKMQNIGDDIIAKNYYQTPHYPMPGKVFQFGFNWRFYD